MRVLPKTPSAPKPYPAPEVIKPGDWDVESCDSRSPYGGCSSSGLRHMKVPLTDDGLAKAVRMHEMAHVKWSPEYAPQPGEYPCTPETILACEDRRIHYLLGAHMRPRWASDHLYVDLTDVVQRMVKEEDDLGLARLIMASLSTGSYLDIARTAQAAYYARDDGTYKTWAKVVDATTLAEQEILGEPYDFGSTVRAAIVLEAMLGVKHSHDKEEGESGERGQPGESSVEKAVEDSLESISSHNVENKKREKAVTEARQKAEEATRPKKNTNKMGNKPEAAPSGPAPRVPVWGKMEIQTPPLVRQVLLRKIGNQRWPSSEGVMPVAPHRLLTDFKVFRRRKPMLGGSQLIDQSGSMQLKYDDVEQLVIVSPMSIIATYCGSHMEGWLRVIARKGRIVDPNQLMINGGNNLVDLPALEWLGRQSMPRVWVSDGLATSMAGHGLEEIEECKAVCRKYKIIRVGTVPEAVDLLKRIRL